MPYRARDIDSISRSVRKAVRQYLPGTDAGIRGNVLYVLQKAMALLFEPLEQRLEWLSKQQHLNSASDERTIEAHAAEYRITRKPATAATGAIEGTGQAGRTYPAGIRFLSANQSYVTTAPATADEAGAIVFSVTSEATGAATNREAEAEMLLADAALTPTLAEEFQVGAGGLGGGADREDIESLRARALDRKRRPPQGGSLSDYEQIALSVPGVVKAWAFRMTDGIGAIGLFFLFEGRTNRIPEAADVAAVDAALEAARLIRVDATPMAPVAVPVPVTISGLARDTAEIRAAIAAALTAMLFERARPSMPDDPFALSRSWIGETISGVTGEDRHILVVPAADVSFATGEYPVLGTVTYA
ncbi:baseplate J/gp47 family protein [Jiella marina]|uniref:baseplate J/gp47 family protein n=1 Tax=Jiella sp. LLJ827 TaxID=2917712 RepID=UPI00210121AB|nr:baseplate J/gp47 family protein [Jiella sp. LLJ827]MCQ0986392.1 baseplate J/gp47 family protein [Jiella sp. LLJ827]